jgi:hypothetical protein
MYNNILGVWVVGGLGVGEDFSMDYSPMEDYSPPDKPKLLELRRSSRLWGPGSDLALLSAYISSDNSRSFFKIPTDIRIRWTVQCRKPAACTPGTTVGPSTSCRGAAPSGPAASRARAVAGRPQGPHFVSVIFMQTT